MWTNETENEYDRQKPNINELVKKKKTSSLYTCMIKKEH